MVASKKKLFNVLYLSDSHLFTLCIPLKEAINYKQYFILTKLILSSFIKMLKYYDERECFYLLLKQPNQPLTHYLREPIEFDKLKKLLTSIKRSFIQQIRQITYTRNLMENEQEIALINTLSEENEYYKHTCIKQLKSQLVRQQKILQTKLSSVQILTPFVQLEDYFRNHFIELAYTYEEWQCTLNSSSSPIIMHPVEEEVNLWTVEDASLLSCLVTLIQTLPEVPLEEMTTS